MTEEQRSAVVFRKTKSDTLDCHVIREPVCVEVKCATPESHIWSISGAYFFCVEPAYFAALLTETHVIFQLPAV